MCGDGVTRSNHSGKSKGFLKYLEAGNDTGSVERDQIMQEIVLFFWFLVCKGLFFRSLPSHQPATA